MRIIVLIKEVPDTFGERHLNLETGLADRAAGDRVIDEIGERALESAIAFAEQCPGTEVVAVSMGPASVSSGLRKALAMGATRAVHVLDERLAGADLQLTSTVIAAAVRRIGFDLVMAGNLSTDGSGGVLPAMVAELLGVPHATNLVMLELTESGLRGKRESDYGSFEVEAPLPAVVSVAERMPDPRMPNFKGILAAKKKPLEVFSLDEIQVDLDPGAPQSIMLSVEPRPQRAGGMKIFDEGDAGERIAEFLVQERMA